MKKIALALVFCLIVAGTLQAQFSLSGEFRPRTEYSHGYKSLADADQNASLFTSQRTRLNLNYTAEKITTKLVLQDVRNWGNQKQLVGNEDFATSIHEAWAEAKLGAGISLQLGRQELVYDNSRIFGNVGWAQQARSHDLLLAKYQGAFKLHFGLAYHQSGVRTNNIYNGPDAYKSMQFLWFNKKLEKLSISLLVLNNGVPYTIDNIGSLITEQGIRYSQTIGSTIAYKFEKLNLGGNIYYQTGTDPSGMELGAYEVLVEAGLALSSNTKVGLSYEILSGTDPNETTVNNSFTPLYGTNHKFNGHMDYFFVGNHMNSVGLQDITISFTQKIKSISLNAHIHAFFSAAALTNGNYLGTEADLFMAYPVADNIKIQLGYSQMFAGEGMTEIKSGSIDEIQNWAYLMFVFTPKFLVNE
ncbi:MAG: alginate export family protein [Bacteroidota bacterium]